MDGFKSHSIYSFQGFELDVRNRRLSDSSGQAVKLNSRSFDILVELVHYHGRILGKDYLMATVWHDLVVEENNVNQAICLVRKALGDSTEEPIYIKTVSGKGFCFVANVHCRIMEDPLPDRSAPDEKEFSASNDPASINGRVPDASWHPALKSGMAGLTILLLLFFFNDHDASEPNNDALNPLRSVNAYSAGAETANIMPDSIAVMPLRNLGEDDSGDLFVLGLHDELISQLTRIKDLKVISRDSIVSVSDKDGPVSATVNSLQIESLITGSILVVQDHAHINLQMLDGVTGVALWSKSFEIDAQDFSEMLSAQRQIAIKVANALENRLKTTDTAILAALPTQSFEAYTYYLTAMNAYTHQDNEGKWLLLSKALALDPEFADAHRMFASVNSALSRSPMQGFTHDDHLRFTQESTEAYIRLKPERSEGYDLKSFVLAAARDWEGAAEQVAILRQLGASNSEMTYVSALLVSMGDFQGAISIFEESLAHDPSNLYARALLMALHEMAGNRDLARRQYALGDDLKPVWWGDTVNVLLAMGRREPLGSVNDLKDISPELRDVLANLQDLKLVNRAVKNYMTSGVENALEDVFYSALAAYHDDLELANTLLQMATDKVSTYIFWAWLPVFDEVRATAQFRNLLVDSGLVDYWQQHGWPEVCQPYKDTFSCDWVAYSE